jgi:uncharacterized protein (DUF4415 family)
MSKNPESRVEARAMALRNLDEITPEEDAEITAAALTDPDNLPMSDDDEIVNTLRHKRGRPYSSNPKHTISMRLDSDLLLALRATGAGWQTRINDMLRKAVGLD